MTARPDCCVGSRYVCIVDVQVTRRRHGWKRGRSFADHDRRSARTDLGIGNAIAIHVTTDLDSAEAPDKKVEETCGAVVRSPRSNHELANGCRHRQQLTTVHSPDHVANDCPHDLLHARQAQGGGLLDDEVGLGGLQ